MKGGKKAKIGKYGAWILGYCDVMLAIVGEGERSSSGGREKQGGGGKIRGNDRKCPMLLLVAMSGPRVFPCPRVSPAPRHSESGLKFLLACLCWLARYTDAPAFSLQPSLPSSPALYIHSPCRVVSNTLSASSFSVPSPPCKCSISLRSHCCRCCISLVQPLASVGHGRTTVSSLPPSPNLRDPPSG